MKRSDLQKTWFYFAYSHFRDTGLADVKKKDSNIVMEHCCCCNPLKNDINILCHCNAMLCKRMNRNIFHFRSNYSSGVNRIHDNVNMVTRGKQKNGASQNSVSALTWWLLHASRYPSMTGFQNHLLLVARCPHHWWCLCVCSHQFKEDTL